MAIYALEGLAEQWFVPLGQGDTDKPTRFLIKPLDGEQFTNLQLMLNGDKLTGEAVKYALRVGLKNWEQFADSNGEIVFGLQNFNRIPMTARLEIASKIYEVSMLSEAQVKNS